jgi:F0F1-type ATP synthase membrane subunit b/b'
MNWKRFLALFALVYVVGAASIDYAFWPPGRFSEAYLAEYKADHDRYLSIIKSPEYKRWSQRPHLNPPDAGLQANIEFVESYTNRDAYKTEQARRNRYELLIDFYNVAMLLVLVVPLARKPLAGVIDNMIEEVKRTIGRAERARQEADARRVEAEQQVARLPEERSRVEAQVAERVSRFESESAALKEQALSTLAQEMEDRMRNEEKLAKEALKRRIIEEAVGLVEAEFQTGGAAKHDALVDRFVANLERPS